MDILRSKIDKSVNFIEERSVGFIESRFVRREDKYFIVYISSQTGCAKACRMCHLTATGQNKFLDVEYQNILKQADSVLEYYDTLNEPAELVHFNFMARGEPFDNPIIVNNGDSIVKDLFFKAAERDLASKVLFSTILPSSLVGKDLSQMFPNYYPEIYYSIYSVDDNFRKKWLNRAMPVKEALSMLKAWQIYSGKKIKIHFAFIEGENDSLEDMKRLCQKIEDMRLEVNMNVVRYNPYSEKYGRESSEDVIYRNVEYLKNNLYGADEVKVVPKVGFDVKASCGMFIEK